MPSLPRGNATKATAAVALLLTGLLCAGLYQVLATTQHHSYTSGTVPAHIQEVTEGETYNLAVAGGVRELEERGVDVSTPRCTYRTPNTGVRALTVQPAGSGTKATNVVGTFVAPVSGDIDVDCLGWGRLFIDDADNASPDVAGGLLVLAVVALTAGFGLGLSAVRSARGEPDESAWAPGEDDEIERLVHLVHLRSQVREVGGGDGDDVLT